MEVTYRRTEFPEKWYDYDGVRLRYVDTGGDGEPVIFVHGLGGRIEDNDLIFSSLAHKYRIISMDQPGSGFSDKPVRKYNVTFLAEFILDFATRFGFDKFKIIGGSQGGLITLLCAHLAPERIEKAIVYSPAGVWAPSPFKAKFLNSLPPGAVRFFFHVTSLFWNSPTFPGFWLERRRALTYSDNAELPGFGLHVLGCVASQFEQDYREIFAQIKRPLLIFWGTHDFGMPVKQGRRLHAIVPDSRFIEVPGAGHNVFNERTQFCADEIIKFFDE